MAMRPTILRTVCRRNSAASAWLLARAFSEAARPEVGFVGLGKIGGAMAANLVQAGTPVLAFDPSDAARAAAAQAGVRVLGSATEVAERSRLVFSSVPDDAALRAVSAELMPALARSHAGDTAVHVSTATVSPRLSVALAAEYAAASVGFVAAPVFARPDGMRRKEATIPVSGAAWAKELAMPYIEQTALKVEDFGESPGAANAVKLGGNFLIAAAIQSMAEAAALCESHGVPREQFISLMNTTIFDCLIYKGYGHRVAARDHFPYPDAHFALDLGSKDVRLVHEAAMESKCPMAIAALLRDRFVASQNAGRGQLDWSAVALRASEDAGEKEAVDATLAQIFRQMDEK